jgi:O-antigen/teichoic acid export membrane protein
MGAWMAVYGLLFGAQFTFMFNLDKSGLDLFLAFLPSLVSLAIGLSYIFFAPNISRERPEDRKRAPEILPGGLVLLGVYWLGSGFFMAVGNMVYFMDIFDSKDFEFFGTSAFWSALGNLAQALGGLILIAVGNRMRSATEQNKPALATRDTLRVED